MDCIYANKLTLHLEKQKDLQVQRKCEQPFCCCLLFAQAVALMQHALVVLDFEPNLLLSLQPNCKNEKEQSESPQHAQLTFLWSEVSIPA